MKKEKYMVKTVHAKPIVKIEGKDPKKQGKANRAAGARFELKVRDDLEKKGWIVDKWSNQVEFRKEIMGTDGKVLWCWECKNKIKSGEMIYPTKKGEFICEKCNSEDYKSLPDAKLVKVKNKFRGKGIPMMIGGGFPDFICFKLVRKRVQGTEVPYQYVAYEVIGVEVKSTGYLKPEEKAKCEWLLSNNIFSKILIAKKGKIRGEIIYTEFESPKGL